MNPTQSTPSPASPETAPQPVVEFVRGQRQTAAYVFLGLSIVFLGLTIWMAIRGFKSTTAEADKPAATSPLEEAPKVSITDPKQRDFRVGAVGTLAGFLITVVAGAWLMLAPRSADDAKQRTEARVILLAVGGLLGFALIIFGGWYLYLWSESLTNWLDKGERKEMLWAVIPLLMIVAGAGLVFTAVQPARADERNNYSLRRLVYGSNFGLTVLLLLVVLVVANVVIAKRVPNQLDATETGFYSLSTSTTNFLGQLKEPVTLYVIMPNSGAREATDLRQFAYSLQDASDGRLTARFVSPNLDEEELIRLREKYPRIERDAHGLLLTVGEDGKRHVFLALQDLFDWNFQTQQAEAFTGEGKVMKELRFLADNETRPVIYFTQGNGELSIDTSPGGLETAIGGSAQQLKSFLEKNYLDIRPLVFPPQKGSVPGDATVVVVAEPQSSLSPSAVEAIREYMTARKGKLIVLSGAIAGPDRKVVKTGLEELLREFNVELGDKFIYSAPIRQAPNYRIAIVAFARAAEQNPIVQVVGSQLQALPFRLPREVRTTSTRPGFQANPLLLTIPGRLTWLESEEIVNPEQAINDLNDSEALQQQKQLSSDPRPVAAIVSEQATAAPGTPPAPATGRVVVYGNSYIFSDRYASERGRSGTPATFDLMSVSIDWLRDRPPVATTIESKRYKEYQFPEPSAIDTTRLIYFPLGLGLVIVAALGAGVWAIRRK